MNETERAVYKNAVESMSATLEKFRDVDNAECDSRWALSRLAHATETLKEYQSNIETVVGWCDLCNEPMLGDRLCSDCEEEFRALRDEERCRLEKERERQDINISVYDPFCNSITGEMAEDLVRSIQKIASDRSQGAYCFRHQHDRRDAPCVCGRERAEALWREKCYEEPLQDLSWVRSMKERYRYGKSD